MKPVPPSTEAMWHAFAVGTSLGQQGSEHGTIIQDEEHRDGARITLERDKHIAPFSITCGIYGLFVHTAFASDESEARRKYAEMKDHIDAIVRSEQHEVSAQLQAFCDVF